MKLAQLLDQQGIKLQRQLLINNIGNEVRAATIDQSVGSWNYNYWSTENEVRTTPIDQQSMKLEQHLLINRAWS